MEPKTYLAGQRIEPLPLPDFGRLMQAYEKFDVGSMGEFDVALLLDEYAGVDISKGLYPDWRGGYYYAAHPKGDPGAALAIVYVSRWASPESATKFAAIYADSLKKRYRSLRDIPANPVNGGGSARAGGTREWLTEEGDVIIDVHGSTAFITESVDDVTSGKLKDAVLALSQTPAAKSQPFQLPTLSSSVSSLVELAIVRRPAIVRALANSKSPR
jgi:hypothetical protein